MRASDQERQRTIDELRRHCAAGRIDVDEYAARIEKAMSATTLEELDHLRADLPMMRIAAPDKDQPGPIWARAALPRADGGSGRTATDPAAATGLRLTAVAVAVLSVMVVLAVVTLSLVAEWAWAAVLLIGWVVGLLQGRLSHKARRGG